MEKAVENVEAMFQKADSDLNHLSQKLKREFEENDDLNVNPAKLVQKIGEVKKEFRAVVEEAAALQEAQKAAVQEFQAQLKEVCTLLQQVQDNTGCELGDRPAELANLEELLGTKIPWGSAPSPVPAIPEAGDATQALGEDGNACSKESLSPRSRRKISGEFVLVTEEEFESVPESTRGRAKLSEINSTYRILWEHFQKNKKCKSLNSQEMHKLGLKVTGHTGQAKLKVLKTLKLLSMSPRGDVGPAT